MLFSDIGYNLIVFNKVVCVLHFCSPFKRAWVSNNYYILKIQKSLIGKTINKKIHNNILLLSQMVCTPVFISGFPWQLMRADAETQPLIRQRRNPRRLKFSIRSASLAFREPHGRKGGRIVGARVVKDTSVYMLLLLAWCFYGTHNGGGGVSLTFHLPSSSSFM